MSLKAGTVVLKDQLARNDAILYQRDGRHYIGIVDAVLPIGVSIYNGDMAFLQHNDEPIGVYLGRRDADGWIAHDADAPNPCQDAVVHMRLVTGAVQVHRADAVPDVAWRCLISHYAPTFKD